MKAFRAAFNAICRNASSAEAIKFNYHTNKDNIDHASGLGKEPFGFFPPRSVPEGRGSNGQLKIPKCTIHDTIDSALQQLQYLTDISIKINDYYGRQILFALTSAFVCITVQLYYLIIHMRLGFAGNEVLALCSCILIVIHVVEFAVILMASDKVKQEVRSNFPLKILSLLLTSKISLWHSVRDEI